LEAGERLARWPVSEKDDDVIRHSLALISAAVAFSSVTVPVRAQVPVGSTYVPSATSMPYRINAGDELEISVWGDERLQRTVLVLPDGSFAFPLVGQVAAAGRLPAELERAISAGLQPQYKGPVPQVTVAVKKASGYQFSVVGKVRSPGTFTPGRYVNALEALAIAGGPTEFAQTGGIRLVRKSGGNLGVVPLRLADALRGDFQRMSPDQIPEIESGDTLVVP
jgi:polysaccharide export outer membrane protein